MRESRTWVLCGGRSVMSVPTASEIFAALHESGIGRFCSEAAAWMSRNGLSPCLFGSRDCIKWAWHLALTTQEMHRPQVAVERPLRKPSQVLRYCGEGTLASCHERYRSLIGLDGELPTTALEADPQGQRPGAAALEGAHPLEGRCLVAPRGVTARSLRPWTPVPMPAVSRIFDGKKEAKLIAFACSNSGFRPEPNCRPRRTYLHLSYSYAY